MEELILYSFNTRVVILFLLYICDKCNIKIDGEAEQYVRNLSPQQFLEYIKDIRIAAFLKDVCRDINQRILDYLKPLANRRQLIVISFSADILSSTTNN